MVIITYLCLRNVLTN